MEIKGRFDHFNINVTNLEKSIQFYEKALGLHESHRKEAADGSFILVNFRLLFTKFSSIIFGKFYALSYLKKKIGN